MLRSIALIVVLVWAAAGAFAAAPEGPRQWLPGDSYPGGAQYDARLDQPVKFWGAGIPLARVFAEAKEQTGVEIGFSPPDDVNARVCVNLYLNPEAPPALRDLLAQLSWATGCTFTVTGDEPRRYLLLATRVGGDAYRKLVDSLDRRRAEEQTGRVEGRRAALAGLDPYRAALSLSDKEAIARYRGTQDALLLTVLSPEHRKSLSLLLVLTSEQLERVAVRGRTAFLPADLSEDQRAEVRRVLQVADPEDSDWALAFGINPGWVNVSAPRQQTPPGERGESRLRARLSAVLLPPDRKLNPREDEELRRLLGEQVDPEEVRRRSREEGLRAVAAALRAQRARMEKNRTLSPAAQDRLAAFLLRWEEHRSYALWQVQEATARATGLHVVSDCFWQPPQTVQGLDALSDQFHALRSQQPPPPEDSEERQPLTCDISLLDLLTALCYPPEPPDPFGTLDSTALGWEWGDAGAFLHFRTRYPGIWRGGLLPAPVVASLDALLQPHLAALTSPTPPASVTCSIPLSGQLNLLRPLDTLQRKVGWRIVRDDVTSPVGLAKQALSETLSHQFDLRETGAVLVLLGSLSRDQWDRLVHPGLNLGKDLTPEQTDLFSRLLSAIGEGGEEVLGRLDAMTIKAIITAPEGAPATAPGGAPTTAPEDAPFSVDQVTTLEAWENGQRQDHPLALPSSFTLHLTPPPPLPALKAREEKASEGE